MRWYALQADLARHWGRYPIGLYLWHGPIVEVLLAGGFLSQTSIGALLNGTLAALLLSSAFAAVTYRLIERPFLDLGRKRWSLGRCDDPSATTLVSSRREAATP